MRSHIFEYDKTKRHELRERSGNVKRDSHMDKVAFDRTQTNNHRGRRSKRIFQITRNMKECVLRCAKRTESANGLNARVIKDDLIRCCVVGRGHSSGEEKQRKAVREERTISRHGGFAREY